jgi:hypothetical protein
MLFFNLSFSLKIPKEKGNNPQNNPKDTGDYSASEDRLLAEALCCAPLTPHEYPVADL